MGKPDPAGLRGRVDAFAEQGHGHREAAQGFLVSPRLVNDLEIMKPEIGGLWPA